MLQKDLEKMGFNEKEAVLYLAALELGQSNIQQLSKKSGIKRTTVYDTIKSLQDKGFLSQYKKKKRTFFLAADPHKFEEDAEERKYLAKKALPDLLAIANATENKPKVSFYEGEEGIREVYRDTLDYPDQEILAWVAEEAFKAFDADFLQNYYIPKRIEKKIWIRAIAPDDPIMRKYKDEDEGDLRKTRLTDAKMFDVDVEINLYGSSRVAVMSFEEKFGMVIESKKLFKTMKSIFEMNWAALRGRNEKEGDPVEK